MKDLLRREETLVDLPVLLKFEQELIKAERFFDVTIKATAISNYDIEPYIKNQDIKVVVAEYKNQLISSGYAVKKRASDFLRHDFYEYLGAKG